MYSLIVVDMQKEFRAALLPEVQKHCKKAIAKAIKNNASIIFLEYEGYGPTLPVLTKLTRNYSKTFHAKKSDWDGSVEAIGLIDRHGLVKGKFKICGVYTDCCVKATLDGLHSLIRNAKFELISKACGPTSEYNQERTIKTVRKMERVRVVSS